MRMLKVLPIILIVFISGCAAQVTQTQPEGEVSTPLTEEQLPEETPPQPTGEGTLQGEVTPSPTVKEFTIRESNYKLFPSTITANKGDIVRITVINDGGTHNLFIEDYNKRSDIVSVGGVRVIEFTADKSGTFGIWCEVGGHRNLGMEGRLVVS